MRVLDLFCGAGGASAGYAWAGHEVVGVDVEPQRHYPYTFIEAEALDFVTRHGHEFDFIHASPPCHRYTKMRNATPTGRTRVYPDMVDETRKALQWVGKPYVIENVPGAPLVNPIMLCGSMFGLQTIRGSQLRRHRLFEASFPLQAPGSCKHNNLPVVGVYGGGQAPDRKLPGEDYGVRTRRFVMQIDWMTQDELSQAIPPIYTEYIISEYTKTLLTLR